jgi:hypothetical protein
MKKIAFIAALALVGHAWAQAEKPAAKEAAKPPVQAEAAKPPVQEAAKAEKRAPKKGSAAKRQEDARHCLEKATNTEIIKCSEEYL